METKFTKPEIATLQVLYDERDLLLFFRCIAIRTGYSRRAIVTAVHKLMRKKLVQKDAAFNEDTGLLCGSGFWLTAHGIHTVRATRKDDTSNSGSDT